MSRLVILFSALVILACTIKEKTKATTNSKPSSEAMSQYFKSEKEGLTQSEVLAWNELKINGMSTFTSLTSLNSKFGQPDSIVENYDHCQHLFDDEYELVYRGGLKFHLKNDSIIAESIKLNEGIRLIYNDLLFDKETTLQEFSILFTQAFERREVVDIDDYPYGNNLTLLKFKENMDALDYVICFFFKDGKLFYVARLFPC